MTSALAAEPEPHQGRRRLVDIRAELDPVVLQSFAGIYRDLGLSRAEEPSLCRAHLAALDSLGLT